jgi:hypothetical protein
MSINSSSLINAASTLDDTKPPTVKAAQDGTTDRGPSERAHARDGIVAPPGLLTRHARIDLKPLVDLQNSMAIDQHYSMARGTRP